MYKEIYNIFLYGFALIGLAFTILLIVAYTLEYRNNRRISKKDNEQEEFIMVSNVDDIKQHLKREGIEIIGSYYENNMEHIVFDKSQRSKVEEFVNNKGDNKYV